MHQEPINADVIIGFGNFNTDIARRAAELYHQGYAPKILFTGGLGRNTDGMLPESEAIRFAKEAMACGVPEEDIRAILSHGYGICTDVEPVSNMEKSLSGCAANHSA